MSYNLSRRTHIHSAHNKGGICIQKIESIENKLKKIENH